MSFGLGRGRTLEPGAYGIEGRSLPDPALGRVDPRAWFPNPAARFELEIGSAKGTFLLQQGELEPATNFLGVEYAGEFYRYAADRVRRRGLANVRLLYADANEFIRAWMPDAIVATIHLYFSDPWPKARHHKRRVVQLATLAEFHRILAPGGELRLVTDHDDLWAWYLAHETQVGHLFAREGFAPPASAGEGEVVGTNWERKLRREGKPFHAMVLRKKGA